MKDDLRTFPSIRALARHLQVDEASLRKRLGRKGKTGRAQGERGPEYSIPLIVSEVPEALEDRLADIDRHLTAVLVRLDAVQATIRALAARFDDEDL